MLIVIEVEENLAFGGVGGGMCLQNAKLAPWLCLFTFKFGNLVEYKQS